MEVLEEALYGLEECVSIVGGCVQVAEGEESFVPMNELSVKRVHERLAAVGVVLRRRLVSLEIAEGAPTM